MADSKPFFPELFRLTGNLLKAHLRLAKVRIQRAAVRLITGR